MYHSASLSCKPSREASTKRVGEKGTLGSFLSLPLPLSILSLPSLSCFPSSSSPFLCLPSSQVPVRRFRRPTGSMHFGGPFLCRLRVVPHFPSGIVERAKRERALLSLRKNGGLLVVYFLCHLRIFKHAPSLDH